MTGHGHESRQAKRKNLFKGLAFRFGGRNTRLNPTVALPSGQLGSEPCRTPQGILFQFVFPKSDHQPAPGRQLPVGPLVPEDIRPQFSQPKFNIGRRNPAVCWAGVPKATIHKNNNLFPPENKIRTERKQSHVPSPPGNPGDPHRPDHGHLRRGISRRPDARHQFRPFFGREEIDHAKPKSRTFRKRLPSGNCTPRKRSQKGACGSIPTF